MLVSEPIVHCLRIGFCTALQNCLDSFSFELSEDSLCSFVSFQLPGNTYTGVALPNLSFL